MTHVSRGVPGRPRRPAHEPLAAARVSGAAGRGAAGSAAHEAGNREDDDSPKGVDEVPRQVAIGA